MAYIIDPSTTKFLMGFTDPSQLKNWGKENLDHISLSFIGRSNVGKSTLINAIFGKGTARTSKTPGRTREVNLFSFQLKDQETKELYPTTFFFFDLPGYGHAQISKEQSAHWNKLMRTFFSIMPQQHMILNLQDARHPAMKKDADFYEFFLEYPMDGMLIFSKLDKLKSQKERAQLKNQAPALFKQFKKMKQVHFVSAEKRIGLEELNQALVSHLLKKQMALEDFDVEHSEQTSDESPSS